MDEYGWAIVIARAVPFVVWSFVAATAPKAIGEQDRYRRLLVVRLMWAVTLVFLFGSLVRVDLVPPNVAVLVYTAFDTVLAIVGVSLLWVFWERES